MDRVFLSLILLISACSQIGRNHGDDRACIECHEDDKTRSKTFDHAVDGFPQDCTECHLNDRDWSDVTFDHSEFPLDGKHATISCDSCHDRDPVPETCIGCHESDRVRAKSPDHSAPGWPTDCGSCHTTSSWEIGDLTCNACHGSDTSDAPPKGVGGETETTSRAVGAHQAHLRFSDWHAVIACADCHVVPGKIDEPGHNDGLPAEVTFSARAYNDSASPSWDRTTCSGVYCHGATMDGGTATAPVWTKVDGSQSGCGSCHGMPPGGDHPAATLSTCVNCHAAVIDASGKIITPQLHINGTLEVASGDHPPGYGAGSVHGADYYKGPTGCGTCHGATLDGGSAQSCASSGCHAASWKTDCNFCHGGTADSVNGSPPESVNGQTATSSPSVGWHASHLKASSTHAAYACNLCHTVPTDIFSPGHIDPSPAELNFVGLASATTYSYQTRQCSNVYCHGASSAGGVGNAGWTTALSGGCTACHKMPPGGTHSTDPDCAICHSAVVAADNATIIAPDLHVNGTAESSSGHPAGYDVGAIHGSDFYQNPSGCAACHGTTLDGGTAQSCASSGCHASNWKTDCTFCHGGGVGSINGSPPESVGGDTSVTVPGVGRHAEHLNASSNHSAYPCATCHTVPTDIFSAGHIDGGATKVTFSGLAAGASYNPSTRQCSNVYCHGSASAGGSGAAGWTAALSNPPCGDCHTMPPGGTHTTSTDCVVCHSSVVGSDNASIIAANLHVNGTVESSSGHPAGYDVAAVHATDFYASPSSCAACHGATLDGDVAQSCATSGCHPAGWKTDCDFCHGGAAGSVGGSPPESVAGDTAVTVKQVGYHNEHLTASSNHSAYACNTCHVVPSDIFSAGHIDGGAQKVTFSGLAAGASYNPSTGACSNVYCHGSASEGGSGSATWNVASSGACTDCHTMPPGGTHSTSGACSDCHATVVDTDNQTIIDASLHVNGTVESTGGGHAAGYAASTVHAPDYYANPASCTACHGATLDGGSAQSCASSGCHPSGWKTDCNFCHGGASGSVGGSPPESVAGDTSPTVQQVGRHTEHLTASTNHSAYACSTCHNIPSDVFSAGHIDNGATKVSFSGIASGGSYTSSTGTCTVYCHGDGRSGSTGTATWTGTVGGCDSCHPASPSTADHNKHSSYDCAACHSCVVDSSNQIVDASLHVNGSRNVCDPAVGLAVGWNGSNGCTPDCHSFETWQ